MNARIKKEIWSTRVLLALALVTGPIVASLFHGHDATGIIVFVYMGASVLLGVGLFGSEFDGRTIQSLFSQPISRQRIWFEKLQFLAVAIAVLCGVTFACLAVNSAVRPGDPKDIFLTLLLIASMAFCSTPYYSLRTKNFNAAVAATYGVPFSLSGIFFLICALGARLTSHPDVPLLQDQFQNHYYAAIGTPAVIYCALLYWLGYREIQRLEIIDVQSKELAFPTNIETFLGRLLNNLLPGYTAPIPSLIRKELHVQRINYVMALFVVVLLTVEFIIFKIHPYGPLDALMVAELFCYTLGIPILAASVCIAEERNWGVTNWQLTLPSSPRRQWTVKIVVALATVLALGVLLPAAVVFLERSLGMPMVGIFTHSGGPSERGFLELFLFSLAYLAIFGVIVFASSVSLNSLHALVFAFGLSLAAGFTLGFGHDLVEYWQANNEFSINNSPVLFAVFDTGARASGMRIQAFVYELVPIFVTIWGIVLLAVLATASYKNFRRGESNPPRKWPQAVVIYLLIVLPGLTLDILTSLHE